MTHSPHPWRLAKSGQIVDANHRAIARVWNTSNHERDKANGELIAMAPSIRDEFRELHADMTRLTEEFIEVEKALALCVRAIDELLPGAKHIPCNVGLINDALIKARPLTE